MRKLNWFVVLDTLIGIAGIANLAAEAWKHWNEAEEERMKRRLDEKLGAGNG